LLPSSMHGVQRPRLQSAVPSSGLYHVVLRIRLPRSGTTACPPISASLSGYPFPRHVEETMQGHRRHARHLAGSNLLGAGQLCAGLCLDMMECVHRGRTRSQQHFAFSPETPDGALLACSIASPVVIRLGSVAASLPCQSAALSRPHILRDCSTTQSKEGHSNG
jgi:hypothetical protein